MKGNDNFEKGLEGQQGRPQVVQNRRTRQFSQRENQPRLRFPAYNFSEVSTLGLTDAQSVTDFIRVHHIKSLARMQMNTKTDSALRPNNFSNQRQAISGETITIADHRLVHNRLRYSIMLLNYFRHEPKPHLAALSACSSEAGEETAGRMLSKSFPGLLQGKWLCFPLTTHKRHGEFPLHREEDGWHVPHLHQNDGGTPGQGFCNLVCLWLASLMFKSNAG